MRVFIVLMSSVFASSAQDCGLYLAISSTSTSEQSLWGVYAGNDIEGNTAIGFPEIAVNIPHLKANVFLAQHDEDDTHLLFLKKIVNYLEESLWVPSPAGAKFELKDGRAVAAIPGIGALSAFNSKLTNCDWNSSGVYQREPQGETPGISHPNRGAISPFYGVAAYSTQHIPAGSEIFLDYGDNWAEEENEDDLSSDDYLKLDQTVSKIIAYFERYSAELGEDAVHRIYRFLVEDVLEAAVGEGKAKRMADILPSRPQELPILQKVGGSLKFSMPRSIRSAEWLSQNGLCLDNIRPAKSGLENVGRGAFATRNITKGGLLAPLPLLHIPDKEILAMHQLILTESGDYVRESDDVVHKQLLYNYVYGHPESSMVFYPVGSVASFINHNNKAEVNAALVWSDHPHHEKSWFQEAPEELVNEEFAHVGLMMEVQATRDIQDGEEIFLDYGLEWQQAWKVHTETWKSKQESGEIPREWPDQAIHYAQAFRNGEPYRTVSELDKDPYPSSVALKAYLAIMESSHDGTADDPSPWGAADGVNLYNPEHLRPCRVLERHGNEDSSEPYVYTVLWKSTKGKKVFISGVPHSAFVFVDATGSSDQFLTHSFRHYIGIPDETFPQGPWRNLIKTT